MPSPSAILDGLTAISNHWRGVAVGWHVLVGMLVISLVSGWRPTERLLAVLITLPLVSVSVLAWSAGNVFNGVVFAGLALVLFRGSLTFSHNASISTQRGRLCRRDDGGVRVGVSALPEDRLVGSHMRTRRRLASCHAPRSRRQSASRGWWRLSDQVTWAATLASAGLLYGLLGVFYLNVMIDLVLLGGALALAGSSAWMRLNLRLALKLRA